MYKDLGLFEVLEAVEKQAYKCKLSFKQCIELVFYVWFLKRDVIRREAVYQKIAG